MKARITVTLKSGVLDPQGKAIQHTFEDLGIAGVDKVRQGKIFDIEIAETNKTKAEAQLKNMSEKLLANMVMENYTVEILD
ncbi:MAG: phosphoribosylformylglycinamidine synthase subunit PurS [Alphaproteobacteria bacterium]|nr:phosphoribosylformylglycinamidine synthase subunit PurS [Alphaproteobacteria bacterium]